VERIFGEYITFDGEQEILRLDETTTVPVEMFEHLFEDAETDYASLVAFDALHGRGYKTFFDKCKERGVLE
jgi:hypothetical protein